MCTLDWTPDFDKGKRLFWKWSNGDKTPDIVYDGIPFVFFGTWVKNCHQGHDVNKSQKKKYADSEQMRMVRQITRSWLKMK